LLLEGQYESLSLQEGGIQARARKKLTCQTINHEASSKDHKEPHPASVGVMTGTVLRFDSKIEEEGKGK
jgi:hypothetical protein